MDGKGLTGKLKDPARYFHVKELLTIFRKLTVKIKERSSPAQRFVCIGRNIGEVINELMIILFPT
jgi:hypothetical protein